MHVQLAISYEPATRIVYAFPLGATFGHITERNLSVTETILAMQTVVDMWTCMHALLLLLPQKRKRKIERPARLGIE